MRECTHPLGLRDHALANALSKLHRSTANSSSAIRGRGGRAARVGPLADPPQVSVQGLGWLWALPHTKLTKSIDVCARNPAAVMANGTAFLSCEHLPGGGVKLYPHPAAAGARAVLRKRLALAVRLVIGVRYKRAYLDEIFIPMHLPSDLLGDAYVLTILTT